MRSRGTDDARIGRALLLPALLLGALACWACADPPRLLIHIDHPPSVDPALQQGKLKVEVLDANTNLALTSSEIDTSSLGSRQQLYDELDLQEDRIYRIRLTARFTSSVCASGNAAIDRRAVGQSPVFTYKKDMGEIEIYLDCADASSATGSPAKSRAYHAAVFLPAPRPHGQVLLIGGAEATSLDFNKPDSIVAHDTIEAFDPGAGAFKLLGPRLTRPRFYHQATVVGDDTAVVTGGFSVEKGTVSYVKLLDTVEQIRQDRVSALGVKLKFGHAAHTAVAVNDDTLLLAGGLFFDPKDGFKLKPVQAAEVYHPGKGSAENKVITLAVPRTLPAAVSLGDGERALLIGGNYAEGIDLPAEVFCEGKSCACGASPCFDRISGLGVGAGRVYTTATRVPCATGGAGAIYVVGGYNARLVGAAEVYTFLDEVHCNKIGTGAWKLAGRLKQARGAHTATLVRGPGGSRRLLVAGGYRASSTGTKGAPSDTAELLTVDCECGAVQGDAPVKLRSLRGYHTATLMADGTVLLVGGIHVGVSVERFNPNH